MLCATGGVQSGNGEGCLKGRRFPLPFLTLPNAPYSYITHEAGTMDPAAV
jgi:hypothetical protein